MEANFTKPKGRRARLIRVLDGVYGAVRGTFEDGVRLADLAQRTNLSVEQTFATVEILEDRRLAVIDREVNSKQWTDLSVHLSRKGAEVLEGRLVVTKKKISFKKKANIGLLGNQSGGQMAVGMMGNNRDAHSSVVVSLTEQSLEEVLEAARSVRSQLSEPHQIGALDAQIEDLKNAKDEPSKRSALERVKAGAVMLGPLAKPLLDIVNDVLEIMKPTV
jgi:hypothetical protein